MRTVFLTMAEIGLLAAAACTPAVPTPDPAQIQASAVAAANTMVALTQAAVPTATPIPPTPLPSATAMPSPTLMALPTLPLGEVPTVAAAAPTSSTDACNAPLAAAPEGPKTRVRLANETAGEVVLSLWLNKTIFGECGYVSQVLGPQGSVTRELPQGCYGAGAFVTEPKQDFKAFGSGCITSDKGSANVRKNGTIVIQ
jgi:hypothetical protein